MAQQRKINIEQAEIKTASIEIKSLIVNARKMTLSVFRQIPSEDIIQINENSVSLAGIPWGQINYFWGDQSTIGIHVLWQNGKELKRQIVSPNIDDWYNEWSELKYSIRKADRENTSYIIAHNLIADGKHVSFSDIDELVCKIQRDEITDSYTIRDYDFNKYQARRCPAEEEKAHIFNIGIRQKRILIEKHEQAKAKIVDLTSQRDDIRDSYAAQYEVLKEIDQLFIAV